MIYRKNNLFDSVQNDYHIPVETVTEACSMDIEKIRKNVFAKIDVNEKKIKRSKRIFIIIAAALITLSTAGLIAVNGSKPVPKYPNQLESDDYNEWIEKNSKIPKVLNIPMPSDEEKIIIDKIQDEYVDFYKNAFQKYSETLDAYEARFCAEEDVIKDIFEKTSTILEKYNYGSVDENDDMIQIIKICCNAMDNPSISLEEKITLKFFVKQTYNFADTDDKNFFEYVDEKMNLTFIPVIDIYTAYSYEVDKYYIKFEEESQSESS